MGAAAPAERGLFQMRKHLGTGIGFLYVSQASQIVHTGVQGQSNAFALLKGIVALSSFNFGIITLIDPGFHLHIKLCVATLFSKVF